MLIRRTLTFIFVAIIHLSGAAQTFRLFLTDLENPAIESVLQIDSTNGIVGGPVFHPTHAVLYYSKNAEILSFNTESGERKVLFTSDAPVHSLRLTPDGKTITFLDRLPGDEIKRITLAGAPQTSAKTATSIDNYTWIDDNNLLVIEPGKPNSLQLVTLRPIRQSVVARHVGRTLTRIPGALTFTFVHKLSVDSWSIKAIGSDGSISILAETLPESEVFTITSKGVPVAFYEKQLHRYNDRTNDWTPTAVRIDGIATEMQSSPEGGKLAFWVKTD